MRRGDAPIMSLETCPSLFPLPRWMEILFHGHRQINGKEGLRSGAALSDSVQEERPGEIRVVAEIHGCDRLHSAPRWDRGFPQSQSEALTTGLDRRNRNGLFAQVLHPEFNFALSALRQVAKFQFSHAPNRQGPSGCSRLRPGPSAGSAPDNSLAALPEHPSVNPRNRPRSQAGEVLSARDGMTLLCGRIASLDGWCKGFSS